MIISIYIYVFIRLYMMNKAMEKTPVVADVHLRITIRHISYLC